MAPRIFGMLEGRAVHEVTIRSLAGAQAHIISWGAAVRDLTMPLRHGTQQRLVLGLNTLEDYLRHSRHFGAVAGRFANRIAHGRFVLDGATWQLPLNDNGKHSLHGGGAGFGRRLWQLAAHGDSFVTMTLVSPDGDSGYPGTMSVACTYRMLEPATLRMELTATCDMPTPLCLSQHSYFNLDGSADILDHTLQIAADSYTPVDADNIPTGEIRSVHGTCYDYRQPRSVRLMNDAGQPIHYDVNFALRRADLHSMGANAQPVAHAATLASLRNGVELQVWTTEPGLQLYDGYKLDVPVAGLGGARYRANAGVCLEAQYFPDSPNHPHFPDAILRPGDVYRQLTEFRFREATH